MNLRIEQGDSLKILLAATLVGFFLMAQMEKQTALGAQTPIRKVIFDTDIADDVDDAYALALVCATPNFQLLGVTTTFGQTHERAQVTAKLLNALGRKAVPVYAGRTGSAKIGRQYEWAKGYNSASIRSLAADEFLYQSIKANPGEVTIIAVGALTNVGDLLTKHPDVKGLIKAVYIMGGAVHIGYNGKPPAIAEWNIKCDVEAARKLFASGVPVVMAGLESTAMMQLDEERQKKLFAKGSVSTDALAALTNLWGNHVPTLFDPVAVAAAGGVSFWETETMHIEVDDQAVTKMTDGPKNVTLLVNPKKEAFLDWYVKTLLDTKESTRR